MNRLRAFVLALCVMVVAGCATPSTPAASTSAPTPEPTRAVPIPSAEDVIATLRRSGGLAGGPPETFVIKRDGSLNVGLTTKQTNGGAAAAQLATQLAASGVFDVAPGKYMPANPCCDRYTYDVTLVKDGKAYNYVTMDASETAPPALFKAIGLIQQYVATAR